MLVRDSHQRPVGDLGISDFQVFDQGKRQQIVFLRRDGDRQTPAAPLAPGQYSNRPAPAIPHVTLVLFDLLNLFGSEDLVNEVARSLQQFESSGNLYFYFLTQHGEIDPVHGLPEATTDLVNVTGAWTQQIRPGFDEEARHLISGVPTDSFRSQATYRAVETLAEQLAPIPGRKDILWIAHDVPKDLLDRLKSLARVNIAINPVYRREKRYGGADTLEELADLTGGKLYYTDELPKAITEVMEAPNASYWIEYAAPPADGKFHKVRVASSRKGARLQVKQGYDAYANEAARETENAALLEQAISSPFDASQIGLRATVSKDANFSRTLQVKVLVDATDVLLLRQGDSYRGPGSNARLVYGRRPANLIDRLLHIQSDSGAAEPIRARRRPDRAVCDHGPCDSKASNYCHG